ncbi:hypothetical protein DBR06_SOUSAS9010077, partial [Sousa chinensis]
SKVLRGSIAWENKDEYLDLIYVLLTDSCYVYGHHSRSSCKISGKGLGFCLFIGRILFFYYNHYEQRDEEGCGFMGASKEGFMAPLTFLCI